MSEKKDKRIPILLKIATLLIAGHLLSFIIFFSVSKNYLINRAAKEKSDDAFAASLSMISALGSRTNFDRLYTDEKFRNQVYRTSRFVCQSLKVRYMYLYTIDDEKNRHYLICAAADDEDDKTFNENYGFGFVQRAKKIYSSEISALNGNKSGSYCFHENAYGHVCMFTMPIYARNGDLMALVGVDFSIENILDSMYDELYFIMAIIFLVFIIEISIALLLIRQSIIRPILNTAANMKRFATERVASVIRKTKKRIFADEISDIEDSFEKMENTISDYIQEIQTLSLEKSQTEAELNIAKRIQNGVVPEEMNFSSSGYDIYGCMIPAQEVGGDFYDIFAITETKICVVVGDISGKGIAAALFMNIVKTAIKTRLLAGMSLSAALNDINRELALSNPENMFATVFTATLDCETGELAYANAGHNAPLLIKKDTPFLHPDPGIALGMFDDIEIHEEKISLSEGEGLVIYTDGVTESINNSNSQYGEERLKEIVSENINNSAKETVCAIIDSVKSFTKGLSQFDDITCTTLLYLGHKKDEMLTPDMKAFTSIKDIILSSLENTERTRTMIMVCEEMFSNIVNYSKADQVSFSCENKEGLYSVTFTDNGIPFDPVHSSQKKRDFEDLDQGGMGIHLARMNTKEMIYSRNNDKNVLILVFETGL